MFMPSNFTYSIFALFFLSWILFWPNIIDFKFVSYPFFLIFTMFYKLFYVKSFFDTFNIIMFYKCGISLTKPSSDNLFLPIFATVAPFSFNVYIMFSKFSSPSSAFVRSNVSVFPFNKLVIFFSYFSCNFILGLALK